jgi:hypothetical protein
VLEIQTIPPTSEKRDRKREKRYLTSHPEQMMSSNVLGGETTRFPNQRLLENLMSLLEGPHASGRLLR